MSQWKVKTQGYVWAVGRWLMAFLDDEILLSVLCANITVSF